MYGHGPIQLRRFGIIAMRFSLQSLCVEVFDFHLLLRGCLYLMATVTLWSREFREPSMVECVMRVRGIQSER